MSLIQNKSLSLQDYKKKVLPDEEKIKNLQISQIEKKVKIKSIGQQSQKKPLFTARI